MQPPGTLPPCVLLFVPGDRTERVHKAMTSGADAVVIDLEDAVASAAKASARAALASFVNTSGRPVYVRINARDTNWYDDDVRAVLAQPQITAVMLPKAEDVAGLGELADRGIIALIETAAGLARAREIAAAPSVVRLAFGTLDYCADLGMKHTRLALQSARSEIVLASRLGGLPGPIDGVSPSVDDMTLAEDDARISLELGFTGKLAIHPKQLAALRRGFAPSESEIQWARAVQAADAGGAVKINGAMVDAPLRALAANMLLRADAVGVSAPV